MITLCHVTRGAPKQTATVTVVRMDSGIMRQRVGSGTLFGYRDGDRLLASLCSVPGRTVGLAARTYVKHPEVKGRR